MKFDNQSKTKKNNKMSIPLKKKLMRALNVLKDFQYVAIITQDYKITRVITLCK